MKNAAVSRAKERGFVSAGDMIGAAMVGGLLAVIGARSFFLSGAIDARANSESVARASSLRSAASACSVVDKPENPPRMSVKLTFSVVSARPDLGQLLGLVRAMGAETGGKTLVPLLFETNMTSAQVDVETSFTQTGPGNMFGSPGGTFTGLSHRRLPCIQRELPSDAQLAKALSRAFFDKLPFGKIR